MCVLCVLELKGLCKHAIVTKLTTSRHNTSFKICNYSLIRWKFLFHTLFLYLRPIFSISIPFFSSYPLSLSFYPLSLHLILFLLNADRCPHSLAHHVCSRHNDEGTYSTIRTPTPVFPQHRMQYTGHTTSLIIIIISLSLFIFLSTRTCEIGHETVHCGMWEVHVPPAIRMELFGQLSVPLLQTILA